jgi:hypothetical protein
MPAQANAADVARALVVPPVGVELVLARRDLLPAGPGFYAWWSRQGAIAPAPHVAHPTDATLGLLYVGISPSRLSSRQTIQGRILRNHLRGNTGSSTFRFVLAALLANELTLTPVAASKHVLLSREDNARLNAWQRENLKLTWCVRTRPWEIEAEVIARMGPPLNSAGNATHPFYAEVKAARAAFRAGAVRGAD